MRQFGPDNMLDMMPGCKYNFTASTLAPKGSKQRFKQWNPGG